MSGVNQGPGTLPEITPPERPAKRSNRSIRGPSGAACRMRIGQWRVDFLSNTRFPVVHPI